VKRSLWLGASLAPLIAPVVWTVIVVFSPDHTPKQERTPEVVLVVSMFLIFFCYIASFILGVPLVKVLRRFEKLSFWWVVLLAIPLGASVFSVFPLLLVVSGETLNWNGIMFFLVGGAAFGFVTAAIFCFLAGITVPSSGRGKQCR
jgi:hypothetical protein